MAERDNAPRPWFGTDGIRGVAGTHPVTPGVATALGRALVRLAAPADRPPRVLVGRDTRRSGPMLEAALVAGVAAEGGEALRLGVIPTPAVARLTVDTSASYGVVISASHNPYRDNGLKVFGADGFKLTDDQEREIEGTMRAILADDASSEPEPCPEAGVIGELPDPIESYALGVLRSFSDYPALGGLRVVVDCANGAAFRAAPRVLEAVGAHVITEYAAPDGRNINEGCGALHPGAIAERVRSTSADAGITLDGDADRIIMVDEKGQVVDGDRMMAILAMHQKRRGHLAHDTLVTTTMSNLGLELALEKAGIHMLRTDVGDRYVVEEMRRGGYNLGGEQSGHLILSDHATTGDGVVAALAMLRVMNETDQPLSRLAGVMTRLPQTLLNVPVREKPPLEGIPQVAQAARDVEATLGHEGRVVLRYSGTEPKARVMIEGPDQAHIEALAEQVAQAIRQTIGAV